MITVKQFDENGNEFIETEFKNWLEAFIYDVEHWGWRTAFHNLWWLITHP